MKNIDLYQENFLIFPDRNCEKKRVDLIVESFFEPLFVVDIKSVLYIPLPVPTGKRTLKKREGS